MTSGLGVNSNPNAHHDDGNERPALTPIEVLQVSILGFVDRPEHRPLVEPEEVGRSQDDTGHREGRPHPAHREGALVYEE
jgi:hypothetical protein